MNLPISLTLLRIFFAPLLVVLLLTKGRTMDLWAVGVFLTAAVTDLLDGYFARKRGQITTLGILLDPIADKLLTSGAFISLVELRLAPAWMVVIIVGREFAVSGLRGIASAEGFILQASDLGKTKMVLQVIAISTLVLEGRVPDVVHQFLGIALTGQWLYITTQLPGYVLLWLVMLFAIASAAQYFWSFWKKLDDRLKRPSRRLRILRVGKGGELSEGPREQEEEEKDVATQ
jgi:CDP-diacylglycerol---glycerol-3-phosphate 3-phosphatidyltransferase